MDTTGRDHGSVYHHRSAHGRVRHRARDLVVSHLTTRGRNRCQGYLDGTGRHQNGVCDAQQSLQIPVNTGHRDAAGFRGMVRRTGTRNDEQRHTVDRRRGSIGEHVCIANEHASEVVSFLGLSLYEIMIIRSVNKEHESY